MENTPGINNDPSDWSQTPYLACPADDCYMKWSISVLGSDEANRLYREHIATDPCKSDIAQRRAAYAHLMRKRVWEFDQYVGSTRAQELGLWKSSTDPDRTWTVKGTVTVEQGDPDHNMVLTMEADGTKLTIESDRDQWGTYYYVQSGKGSRTKVMAQEDGTRSWIDALINGLSHLRDAMDYRTKDASERGTPDETGGSGD